jgi:chondroitin AC lyase
MMVHHGLNYYLSVKTPSKRTVATECGNDENLKCRHFSWGATNIMVDGDEYQNIFPIWDWARVPGVTNVWENVKKIIPNGIYIRDTATLFAGGVSNAQYGLSVYDFSRDSLQAKKAYFFTPDGMYCLGTAIASRKRDTIHPVITNVNQCKTFGNVWVNDGTKTSLFEDEIAMFDSLKWVHHNNVGYYFPKEYPIQLLNQNQKGSWYDINFSQDKSIVNGQVFSLLFHHGKKPVNEGYEYMVIPDKNKESFEKWLSTNTLTKIANSATVQAFADTKNQVYAAVFYSNAKVSFDKNLILSVDKPCLVIIQKNSANEYTISVADPTQQLQQIELTLSKKLKGKNVIKYYNNNTVLKFDLPKADESGKTVTEIYY